jgi:hypothetical protein
VVWGDELAGPLLISGMVGLEKMDGRERKGTVARGRVKTRRGVERAGYVQSVRWLV